MCAPAVTGSHNRDNSPGCHTMPCPRTFWQSGVPRSLPARARRLSCGASPLRVRLCGGAPRRAHRAPTLRRSATSALLQHRGVKITVDYSHDVVIGHLGQVNLVAACQKLIRQALLRIDQSVNLLLYRAAADELVYQDVLLLADPERSVGSLILDRRIPPAIKMHHMGCRGQGQTGATCLKCPQEEWN